MNVHVAFAADEKYLLALSVALVSLLENCPQRTDLEIHLLFCGPVSESARDRLRLSIAPYSPNLRIHDLGAEYFQGLSAGLHFSLAVYARLYLAELLPELDKIVYLDSDVLLLGDVRELYAFEPGKFPVLAAPDWTNTLGHPFSGLSKDFLDSLGVSEGSPMFNSGVLVLDLQQWRREELGQKILGFARTHSEALHLPDQNCLNLVLHGRIGRLDPRWNKQFIYKRVRSGEWNVPAQVHAWDPPKLLHFISEEKPWLPGCELEEQKLYIEYWRKTKWPVQFA